MPLLCLLKPWDRSAGIFSTLEMEQPAREAGVDHMLYSVHHAYTMGHGGSDQKAASAKLGNSFREISE